MAIKAENILEHPPAKPDTSAHYLLYLHGLIVEFGGIRPKSEEHGYYEYQLILEELAKLGFIVISEVREKNTQIQPYAEKIADQIKDLMGQGVPPEHITVVGASRGGAIAANISSALREKRLNYVILAGLFEKYLVDENLKLHGNVLSIHDRSDKLGITPQPYFQRSEGLGDFEEIILDMGTGHGLLYKPYPEWLEPMKKWLKKGEAFPTKE